MYELFEILGHMQVQKSLRTFSSLEKIVPPRSAQAFYKDHICVYVYTILFVSAHVGIRLYFYIL